MERKIFENMQYVVKYPIGYKEGEKYPVLLFLHGAGTRGTDITALEQNVLFTDSEVVDRYPFVTVAPLCHGNSWFDHFETLRRFVLAILEMPYTDSERVYVIGNSMGGYGTWALGMSMPECFAAIVPICGGGMYWNAEQLKHTPVWAFHGALDETVYPEESKKMVDAVNLFGGKAKLTIYPDCQHHSWEPAFKMPELYEWLLEQKNTKVKEIASIYNDAKLYG